MRDARRAILRSGFVPLALVCLLATGCETLQRIGAFKSEPKPLEVGLARSFSFASAEIIDTGDFTVNNDISSSCLGGSGVGLLDISSSVISGRGCMQQPQLEYRDSRWHVGFVQQLGGFMTTSSPYFLGFSAIVNLTSLTTGLFQDIGTGYEVIDPGGGQTNPPTTSARYLQFAKLPSGNLAAVYWLEDSTSRRAYASLYDAVGNAWDAGSAIGTNGAATDAGTDFTGPSSGGTTYKSQFCRPAIAGAGDGTAIAAWCEGSTSGIKFSKMTGSSWSANADITSVASTLAVPGYSIRQMNFTPGSNGIESGKTFTASIDVTSGGTTTTVTTTVSAVVTGEPGPTGQFKVATESDGTTIYCDTLGNMISAMLATTPSGYTDKTLAQRGVSIALDPACAESDTPTSATYKFTVFYNRNLNNIAMTPSSTNTDNYVRTVTTNATGATLTSAAFYQPVSASATAPSWERSAEVALAGDDYGNYALLRTIPVPIYFSDLVSAVAYARRLVGHQYLASTSSWLQTTDNNTSHGAFAHSSYVSGTPACFDGSSYYPCSPRNPKFLMSEGGSGLILYYQNQADVYQTSLARFPARLWYSTYSTSSGFSSGASTLDIDVVCDTASNANDRPVCETGSFSNDASHCQFLNDRQYCSSLGGTIDCTAMPEFSLQSRPVEKLNHDIPPIAAAMNADGEAIVAYAKQINTGTATAPECDSSDGAYIGISAVTYDTFNGFGSTTEIGGISGDAMHPAVAIDEDGDAAVVWEEYVSSSVRYVYLKQRINGSWQSAEIMNTGYTSSAQSMMPAVSLNADGEVMVSFTYGATGGTRRQYVKRFYYH